MDKPLAAKLLIKADSRAVVLGAPPDYLARLRPLPEGASVATAAAGKSFDVVQLFAPDSKALVRHAKVALGAVRDGGALWLCYPKSGQLGTDLTRDHGWGPVADAGWIPVTQVALDATWSALRFKPASAVKTTRTTTRSAGSATAPKERVRHDASEITAPADLAAALKKSTPARTTWDALAYSHRKEYVRWIEEAKRPETRTRRVTEAVAMMASGTRDRNVKYQGK